MSDNEQVDEGTSGPAKWDWPDGGAGIEIDGKEPRPVDLHRRLLPADADDGNETPSRE